MIFKIQNFNFGTLANQWMSYQEDLIKKHYRAIRPNDEATKRTSKYEANICLFDGGDFWNFHESQTKTTIDRLFVKKY